MDKAKLEELRGIAEQRCTELYKQLQDVTTELERTRGDYRTYDSLLLNWKDISIKGVPLDDLVQLHPEGKYELFSDKDMESKELAKRVKA